VFAFFAITAGSTGFLTMVGVRNVVEVAADIGIIAAPITLLLIAGEFDLSVGSMLGASQTVVAYCVVYEHWPLAAAFGVALAIACVVGALNGLVVVKTGLPSFIVTLAALFAIRGLSQGTLRALANETQIGNVREALSGDPILRLFNGYLFGLPLDLFWWIGVVIAAAWILDRTKFGNWIYASGGSLDSAQKRGVPVHRLKVLLYMATAASTVVVATLNIFAINQSDVNAGLGREFEVVTAAVIGGALLTGGFGSAIGSAFGALLFGMVVQGFFFTDIPDVWYQVFLGGMLLLSVVINKQFREFAVKSARRL
jgi:simple sugar transport system permease protein